MFPRGPFARQQLDLAGPFTVARKDMLLAVPGHSANVVVPVGKQLPDWRTMGLLERQVRQLHALGYLEPKAGEPWQMPPSDAELAAKQAKAKLADQQAKGAQGRR